MAYRVVSISEMITHNVVAGYQVVLGEVDTETGALGNQSATIVLPPTVPLVKNEGGLILAASGLIIGREYGLDFGAPAATPAPVIPPPVIPAASTKMDSMLAKYIPEFKAGTSSFDVLKGLLKELDEHRSTLSELTSPVIE